MKEIFWICCQKSGIADSQVFHTSVLEYFKWYDFIAHIKNGQVSHKFPYFLFI